MAKNSWKKVTRNTEFYPGLRFSIMHPREDDPGNYNYRLGVIESIENGIVTAEFESFSNGPNTTECVPLKDINFVNPTVTEEMKEAIAKFPIGTRIEVLPVVAKWDSIFGVVTEIKYSCGPPKHRNREHITIMIEKDNGHWDMASYGVGAYTPQIKIV